MIPSSSSTTDGMTGRGEAGGASKTPSVFQRSVFVKLGAERIRPDGARPSMEELTVVPEAQEVHRARDGDVNGRSSPDGAGLQRHRPEDEAGYDRAAALGERLSEMDRRIGDDGDEEGRVPH